MRRLEACSLAFLGFLLLALLTICLVFFTLPLSFQMVECTHRSLCHHNVPLLHAGILNIQNHYHLRRQVPPHVMRWERWKGCWKEHDMIMILTDGFMYVVLGYIIIYIHTYRQNVFNNLNLENDVRLFSFFSQPHLISFWIIENKVRPNK